MLFRKLLLSIFIPKPIFIGAGLLLENKNKSLFSKISHSTAFAKLPSRLWGKVICADTQQHLEGVVVSAEELSLIAVTNHKGEFILDFSNQLYIPEKIKLIFSNKSHQEKIILIEKYSIQPIEVRLVIEKKAEKKNLFCFWKSLFGVSSKK